VRECSGPRTGEAAAVRETTASMRGGVSPERLSVRQGTNGESAAPAGMDYGQPLTERDLAVRRVLRRGFISLLLTAGCDPAPAATGSALLDPNLLLDPTARVRAAVTRPRCRHGDGPPSIRRPLCGTPVWPATCSCAAGRRRRQKCAQGRRCRPCRPPRHTPAVRTRTRCSRRSSSRGSEEFVQLMLPMGVAPRTQNAHGLVAGPERPAVARSRYLLSRKAQAPLGRLSDAGAAEPLPAASVRSIVPSGPAAPVSRSRLASVCRESRFGTASRRTDTEW
jgi:hypothetical protein